MFTIKQNLTNREKILRAIRHFIEEYGYAPSIRELARLVGFKSTKAVKVHLDKLAAQGLIQRIPGQARSIRVGPKTIPIVGRVSAGLPELAFEELIAEFSPDIWQDCFMLKIKGDSMNGAHIYDGDLVVVKPTKEVSNNDIVVALVQEETTVKRLKKTEDGFILKPENDLYPVIKENFEIIGKVISVVRHFQ